MQPTYMATVHRMTYCGLIGLLLLAALCWIWMLPLATDAPCAISSTDSLTHSFPLPAAGHRVQEMVSSVTGQLWFQSMSRDSLALMTSRMAVIAVAI